MVPAVMVLAASTASAASHGGGGHGGGHGGHGGHSHGGHHSSHGVHHSGHHYVHHSNYGGYGGYGYGLGYSNFGYRLGYGNYGYGNYGYNNYGYGYPTPYTNGMYDYPTPLTNGTGVIQSGGFAPVNPASPAVVTVIVPLGAQVWFDGVETNNAGMGRSFTSPVLQPGQTSVLSVKILSNGSSREMQLPIRSGDRMSVDLSR